MGSRSIESAAYCNQILLVQLYINSTQNTSANWIIRLLLSILCLPKMILFSGVHCIFLLSFHFLVNLRVTGNEFKFHDILDRVRSRNKEAFFSFLRLLGCYSNFFLHASSFKFELINKMHYIFQWQFWHEVGGANTVFHLALWLCYSPYGWGKGTRCKILQILRSLKHTASFCYKYETYQTLSCILEFNWWGKGEGGFGIGKLQLEKSLVDRPIFSGYV